MPRGARHTVAFPCSHDGAWRRPFLASAPPVSMILFQRALLFAISCLCLPGIAHAYEEEQAVPLTIDAVPGKVSIEAIALSLHGRVLDVATRLHNPTTKVQTAGFYARTGFFRQLGEAEEHADKRFADFSVSFAGKTMRAPGASPRGFFMGRDITAALSAAGIPPLPDHHVDVRKLAKVRFPHAIKADDWEGYVAYSWTHRLAAGARGVSTVRHTVLPEFGRMQTSSREYRDLLRAHCGEAPEDAAADAKESDYVVFERYELPVRFMRTREVAVTVTQPALNWLKLRPVRVLACGLSATGNGMELSGTLESAGDALSVLVISRMPG